MVCLPCLYHASSPSLHPRPCPPPQRQLLAPTRWQHGDVALMCVATAQLAYSWIVLPQVGSQGVVIKRCLGLHPPASMRTWHMH